MKTEKGRACGYHPVYRMPFSIQCNTCVFVYICVLCIFQKYIYIYIYSSIYLFIFNNNTKIHHYSRCRTTILQTSSSHQLSRNGGSGGFGTRTICTPIKSQRLTTATNNNKDIELTAAGGSVSPMPSVSSTTTSVSSASRKSRTSKTTKLKSRGTRNYANRTSLNINLK